MTIEQRLLIAEGDVLLYARKLTLKTGTIEELRTAVERWDRVAALVPTGPKEAA